MEMRALYRVLVIGCAAGCEAAPPLEISQSWGQLAPMVPIISWTAPEGAESWVEFGLEGSFDRRTPSVTSEEVTLPLLGLKGGRAYSWRAVSVRGAQRSIGPRERLEVPDPPSALPRLVVDLEEDGAQAPTGYLIGATTTSLRGADIEAFVAIWDGEGDPVWWQQHAPGRFTLTPSLGSTEGTIVWDEYADTTETFLVASGHRMRLDGSEHIEAPLLDGTHAVAEPSPDVFAWAAHDLRPSDPPETWLTADRVLEAPLQSIDSPREVTNLYRDLFDGVHTAPCPHSETPAALAEDLLVYQWSHLNSLAWIAERDSYLIGLRWLDTLVLVDRTQGIQWRLSGPFSDFTSPSGEPLWSSVEDTILSHPHFSQAWDGGLVVFDNGSHRSPPASSVVEIAWDEDARTASVEFRWQLPNGRFVNGLGDAIKLPGGNYLVSSSSPGDLLEVDPAGRERWHARVEPDRFLGRIVFAPDLYQMN